MNLSLVPFDKINSLANGFWKPTGISPSHVSHVTPLIACDALNAQAVTIEEYHYACCASLPLEYPAPVTTQMFVALPHGVMAHRLMRLFTAGTLFVRPILPRRYLARLSFSKISY